MNLITHF